MRRTCGLTSCIRRCREFTRHFGALAAPAVLDYLRDLGNHRTILPAQGFIDEATVAARGLVNYWGYNTSLLCAGGPFFSNGELGEFKTMVKALHETGLEVILDVYTTHAKAMSSADVIVSAHRQRILLPSRCERSPLLRGLHRLWQLVSICIIHEFFIS